MKIGFCLQRDLISNRELLARLDELGYDGVEVWAQAFDSLGLDGVTKELAPYTYEVASVNPYFDFTTSEASYHESLRIADQYIGYARHLGCTRIRTFTSKMGSFRTSDAAEPMHWERAVTGLREVCERAAPFGIDAVMEVHFGDGQLYDTSDATLRLLKDVDRDNLTVNLQPPLRGELLQESAARLGPHVTHLHAHNWEGGWGNFRYLDEGDEDFEGFLRTVHSHGFDGYVSIEHAVSDPFGFAEHNAAYLRDLFTKMERGG